jgi:uncharacterized protein (TIGR02145 family)
MFYKVCVGLILGFLFLVFSSKLKANNPESINYESVTIGTQTWMIKNLDVDHYLNGDPIPEVKNASEWSNLSSGAWCYYSNDPVIGKVYGKLYNWYALNDPRGLAPKGWHIPKDVEWKTLLTFLSEDVAGAKMKEVGTSHWISPNQGATNESGFSALPSGWRNYDGPFYYLGSYCNLWSANENSSYAWYCALYFVYPKANLFTGSKNYGFSIRCLKD